MAQISLNHLQNSSKEKKSTKLSQLSGIDKEAKGINTL